METTVTKRKRYRHHFAKKDIPKSLIYEMYDGKPMYYRGYKDVLNQVKTAEEIIGQSFLQAIIVNIILKFLIKNIDDEKHFVASNETGFHISKNTNVSSDLVIFDKKNLQNSTINEHYFNFPPLTVIEVDIDADTFSFGINEFNYYSMKTKKLLDFGVKEVFWFFSKTKQVAIARPNEDWIISTWDKELVVLDQYSFSLNNLLEKEGFNI